MRFRRRLSKNYIYPLSGLELAIEYLLPADRQRFERRRFSAYDCNFILDWIVFYQGPSRFNGWRQLQFTKFSSHKKDGTFVLEAEGIKQICIYCPGWKVVQMIEP